jgi:hypothetical protein
MMLTWVTTGASNYPLLLAVWLGIVAVLVAKWLWSFRHWEVSLLGLLLIGGVLFLALAGTPAPESPTPYQEIVYFLTLPVFTLSILSILPGIVGLFLARRTGVLAALVFVGSAFVIWEAIGDPEYALLLWTDNAAIEMLVALHPSLFFLILTPIASLLTRSTKAHFASFLLPIAVGLVSAAAIADAVRPYPSFVHSVAVDFLAVLLPLTIFMILYAKKRNLDKNQTFSLASAYK